MTSSPPPVVIVCVVGGTDHADHGDLRVRADDLRAVREAVTRAVEDHLDLLAHTERSGGLNATAVDIAHRDGVSPAWVRANADALGGVRLGTGSKPRLRFNVDTVDVRIAAMGRNSDDRGANTMPLPHKRRPRPSNTEVPLLPIKGPTPASRRDPKSVHYLAKNTI